MWATGVLLRCVHGVFAARLTWALPHFPIPTLINRCLGDEGREDTVVEDSDLKGLTLLLRRSCSEKAVFSHHISAEKQKQELRLAVPLILSLGCLQVFIEGSAFAFSLRLFLGHDLTLLTLQGKLVLWAPPGTCCGGGH